MFSKETTVESLTMEQIIEIAEKLNLPQSEVVWAMPASKSVVRVWSGCLNKATNFADAWRFYDQVQWLFDLKHLVVVKTLSLCLTPAQVQVVSERIMKEAGQHGNHLVTRRLIELFLIDQQRIRMGTACCSD